VECRLFLLEELESAEFDNKSHLDVMNSEAGAIKTRL
jgi:hypothetical protein